MTFGLEQLSTDHRLEHFSSGNVALDTWLVEHAASSRGQGTRTYVLVDRSAEASRQVAGYFAIAPHLIRRAELARTSGRGAPRLIPAILLAKLALDESLQGQGLGSELLIAALTKIVAVARSAGGKLVVVDAIDRHAHDFYAAHGFEPLPADGHRLVLKLSTVARELGVDWP